MHCSTVAILRKNQWKLQLPMLTQKLTETRPAFLLNPLHFNLVSVSLGGELQVQFWYLIKWRQHHFEIFAILFLTIVANENISAKDFGLVLCLASMTSLKGRNSKRTAEVCEYVCELSSPASCHLPSFHCHMAPAWLPHADWRQQKPAQH